MSDERSQLESTVAGLEAQRALLGDAIMDAALAPMRARLAALSSVAPLRAEPSQVVGLLDNLGREQSRLLGESSPGS